VSTTNDVVRNKTIERFALAAGILQPLITLPQIIQIYSNQSAQDVSLTTWLGYLVFGVIFLIYGYIFKLRPIFYGQIIWVTMQCVTVIGILLYD
jgi:uncharacterized protein with PQ loop repeat